MQDRRRAPADLAATVTKRARGLPLGVAALVALIHLATHPGLYFPDTTAFLRERWLVGSDLIYLTILPGYPTVLDLLTVLVPSQARMFALVLAQQAAVLTVVWSSQRIIERAGHPQLAITAALAVALYQPLYLYAQTAQTEAFFVAFSVGAVACAVDAWKTGRTWPAVFAGVLAGFSMAQRSVGIAVPVAMLVTLVIVPVARRWRFALVASASLALVVTAFAARNYAYHGSPRLVRGTGIHLFGRVAAVDKTLASSNDARRLEALALSRGVAREQMLVGQGGWRMHQQLTALGLDPADADALLARVAMQSLAARPVATVVNTGLSVAFISAPVPPLYYMFLLNALRPERYRLHLKLAADAWKNDPAFPAMSRDLPPYPSPVEAYLDGPLRWPFEAWGVLSLLARGPWWVVAAAWAGIIGLRQRDPAILVTAGTAAGEVLLSALGDGPELRYWDPAVPLLIASVALAWRANNGRIRIPKVTTYSTTA